MAALGARVKVQTIAVAAMRARRGGVLRDFLASLLRGWLQNGLNWLAADVAERRLFLWLPAAMGLGVVLYFAADSEPALIASVTSFVIFGLGAWASRGRPVALPVCVGLAAVLAGHLAAIARAELVAAPRIERVSIAEVRGFVEQMDYRPEGARFLLRLTAVEGIPTAATPFRVRSQAAHGQTPSPATSSGSRRASCRRPSRRDQARMILDATPISSGSAPSEAPLARSRARKRTSLRLWVCELLRRSIASGTS
ncbi:MAG: hypothetical protein ABWZ80_01145 [Beijerinckiaceae bacterium]